MKHDYRRFNAIYSTLSGVIGRKLAYKLAAYIAS